MPLYAYQCECGEQYEEFFTTVKEAEELEKNLKCPKCSSQTKDRLLGNVRPIFKGGGWTPRGKDYDSTSSLKDHAKDIKKEKDSWTSKDLYGD